MMTKTIDFIRYPDYSWYAVLPDYPGPRADCQMVMGADTLLEILSQGEGKVRLQVTADADEQDYTASNGTVLNLIRVGEEEGGGYYHMDNHMGIKYDLSIWLCEVTQWVFGYLPMSITFHTL